MSEDRQSVIARLFASRALVSLVAILSATLSGCWTLPREEPGRAPAALGPEVLALRPRGEPVGLRLELVEDSGEWQRHLASFEVYCEVECDYRQVTGDYYLPRERSEDGRTRGLILLSPILAGTVNDYLATRYFAEAAAEAGFAAFFLHQEETVLDGRRDAWDLEARIRQSSRDSLQALDLFAVQPEIRERFGSIGISFGAIKNVNIAAAEPRLEANVFALAGSELDEILRTSQERLVLDYLKERERLDGLTREEVAEEIEHVFISRPEVFARTIANDRVLLFLGTIDNKVPYETGCALREQLGRPETREYPLGHYTSVLIAPWAAGVAVDWLGERLDRSVP